MGDFVVVKMDFDGFIVVWVFFVDVFIGWVCEGVIGVVRDNGFYVIYWFKIVFYVLKVVIGYDEFFCISLSWCVM